MPKSSFQLTGQWQATPLDGGLLSSGAISDSAPISEQVTLAQKNPGEYDLLVDTPVAVAFGGVVSANVIVISTDRPITVRLTSPSGAIQSVPVDDFLAIISRTNAYTAIDLTRQPATETHVSVFLGQKA